MNLGFGGLFKPFNRNKTDREDEREENKLLKDKKLIDVDNSDGSEIISSDSFTHTTARSGQTYNNQASLINSYREMSTAPEVDDAIDDIVNAIVSVDDDEESVKVDFLENNELSDKTKKSINEGFDKIKRLLDFENVAYELVRQFYVDARLAYQIIPDKVLTNGITDLIMIDPRTIKKIKKVERSKDENGVDIITKIEESYLYDPQYAIDNNVSGNNKGNTFSIGHGRTRQRIQFSLNQIAFIHSGIISPDGQILSHLEKAKKPLNNLRSLEDSLVIYRLSRAPERRAFYIDVGGLTTSAATRYLHEISERFRTKINYDAKTGKIDTSGRTLNMYEDYWLPRREGRGTEISTLEGASNLGDIDDVLLFKNKLLDSLNIPKSRYQDDATLVFGNRDGEISRDEHKFNKFINRIRNRFNGLFRELLKQELILTKVTNEEDWETIIEPNLLFIYASDGYLKEQQEIDTFLNRVNAASAADSIVGRYISTRTVYKTVFNMTDEEIDLEIEQMKKEGIYKDPKDEPTEEDY